jgi:hypothetical protein
MSLRSAADSDNAVLRRKIYTFYPRRADGFAAVQGEDAHGSSAKEGDEEPDQFLHSCLKIVE